MKDTRRIKLTGCLGDVVTLIGVIGTILSVAFGILALTRPERAEQLVGLAPTPTNVVITEVVEVSTEPEIITQQVEVTREVVVTQIVPVEVTTLVEQVITATPAVTAADTEEEPGGQEGSPAVLPDAPTSTIEVSISKRSTNYNGEVEWIVDKIELLANGRMRWHISLWNHTNGGVSLGFGADRSYLADEQGNQYTILAMEPSEFIDSGIPAGVRLRGWLEFDMPQSQVTNFQLHLIRWTYGSQQLYFDSPLEVTLSAPLSQR